MIDLTSLKDGLETPLIHGLSIWTLTRWSGVGLALLCIPSVLMQRRDRPMAALAWILCMIELPFIGVILWWVYGLTHMRRRRRKRRNALAKIDQKLKARYDALGPIRPTDEPAPPDIFDIASGIFPSASGNAIAFYPDGIKGFDAFEEAIRNAKDHVHFEFYIWEDDETGKRFRELLVQKAREGVEVRALYDGIGGKPVHGKFMKPLKEAGGQVAPFLPVSLFERRLRINFRNHRKIIVIDGQVAFTGGINIADEYREWHDTACRFAGPVVFQFQEVFAEDWYFATGEDLTEPRYFPESLVTRGMKGDGGLARVLASGPDMQKLAIHKAFFMAITMARERLWLITPYFIPDQAITVALETAAMRGVDVRIILPARDASDVVVTHWAGRAFYSQLLDAGVKIYEFSGKILHAKHLVVDHEWSFVGSANMDLRSFRLNFETNCIIEDEAITTELADFFTDSLAHCEQIVIERFQARPDRARLLEGVTRLFSPLL